MLPPLLSKPFHLPPRLMCLRVWRQRLPRLWCDPATPILVQRPEGIDQMDWPTLQHTVSQCQACSLCGTRHNTVFGVGAKAAARHKRRKWIG